MQQIITRSVVVVAALVVWEVVALGRKNVSVGVEDEEVRGGKTKERE